MIKHNNPLSIMQIMKGLLAISFTNRPTKMNSEPWNTVYIQSGEFIPVEHESLFGAKKVNMPSFCND